MPSNPALRNREPARALTIDGFLARSAAGTSTIAFYGDELRRFERNLGAPLGSAPTKTLERLKGELRKSKSGPTRCRLLRQFYTAAGQDDRADIFRLRRRDSRLSADEILTRPEINRMIGAARSLRDRALLVVVWETGARISEILHLDVRHVRKSISREGREILHVDFRKVKVKGEERKGYVIEGVSHVRAWLESYKPESEDWPLFPSGRGQHARMDRDGPERLVKKIAVRAGITKRVYPHLFRHSRTTDLLRLGRSDSEVAKLLGWRNTRMLARYAHLVDQDAETAALRAAGLEPAEPVTIERLTTSEGELQPVVPIVISPGARSPVRELLELASRNPNVEQALSLLLSELRTGRQVPPA